MELKTLLICILLVGSLSGCLGENLPPSQETIELAQIWVNTHHPDAENISLFNMGGTPRVTFYKESPSHYIFFEYILWTGGEVTLNDEDLEPKPEPWERWK